MNLIIITGNLGKDATQRLTPSGDSIVSFSVPAKSGYGDKQKTSWVRCSMFGKRGEGVFPYLKKGVLVGVSGEFSMNEWTDKEGQPKSTPECRVNDLTLLGGTKDEDDDPHQYGAPKQQPQRNAQGAPRTSIENMDDEIPFTPHGAGKEWRVI